MSSNNEKSPIDRKLDYYRELHQKTLGYTDEQIDCIINAFPTKELALASLRTNFNSHTGAYAEPDRSLEAPDLEYVRETYDPPRITKSDFEILDVDNRPPSDNKE